MDRRRPRFPQFPIVAGGGPPQTRAQAGGRIDMPNSLGARGDRTGRLATAIAAALALKAVALTVLYLAFFVPPPAPPAAQTAAAVLGLPAGR